MTYFVRPEHEMEQFEDDPLEFIRLDLALPSMGMGVPEIATRRQAAADVLQALVNSGYEAEATEIVGDWIGTGLQEYNANPSQNWKAKDSAIYLLTAVATRGLTTQVRESNACLHLIPHNILACLIAWRHVDKCPCRRG
jgi:exportin-2 (importin alpha re-exporter)